MDADTDQIAASALTGHDEDDAGQVGPLLDQVARSVSSFTGDGAYDQESVYADEAGPARDHDRRHGNQLRGYAFLTL